MQSIQVELTHRQTVTDLLAEAATLMGVGMLSVFVFLVLLILAMQLLAWVVVKFPGNPSVPSTSYKPASQVGDNSSAIPKSTVAAISAAVHQYRQQKTQ